MQVDNILVGLVKNWKYLNNNSEFNLGKQPIVGSVYQILETNAHRVETDEAVKLYQLYIGKDSNPAKMDTIFLGEALSGNYNDQWEFDIELVDKNNLADLKIKAKDLNKVSKWLKSNNKELKALVNGKAPKPHKNGELQKMEVKESMIEQALHKVLDFDKNYEQALTDISVAVNTIVGKDTEGVLVLAGLLKYIASTHDDKYEKDGNNIAKDFLMQSPSPDVALFNAIKYVQRYRTVGFEKSNNIQDLYKAIHYIMFELQRKNNIND